MARLNRKLKKTIFIIIAILVVGPVGLWMSVETYAAIFLVHDKNYPDTVPVSIIELLGSPYKYDGNYISVSGYLVTDEESCFLFLSKSDFENGLFENSIRIRAAISNNILEKLRENNNSYVSIRAKFRAISKSTGARNISARRTFPEIEDVYSIFKSQILTYK